MTPVVGLISANFEPIINEAEVSSVFTVPLDRFMISEGHQFIDINWMLKPFRSHRFDWAGYSIWVTLILIQGFTSSVCVRVAMIAYDREPEFQFLADGQPNHKEIIKQVEWSLLELEKPNL